jgi:aspartyl-tRNA(Asn)/glutamyl-tRNA(Gln) amidotransferase subunit A
MPKIKGSHTAMKSGIIAAETIVENIKNKKDLSIYEKKFKKSWAYKELYAARNVKPSFSWGLILGIIFTGLDQILFRGKLPFTLKHKHADHKSLELANETHKLAEDLKELNCFVTMNKDASIEKSKIIDQADKTDSVLSGIPLAQKDLFCTEGLRTTCSSKILSNFIPPYTATAVMKLESAGSITIGKTNMDEFAMGSSNETSYFGNVHNPWKKGYVPGGSSGGSAAAVAAGIVPAATGTDTGGSIRQPAAHCGITGIKPTYGRVSRWGMIAFASSLDQAGPLARSAEDCAILLNEMSGHDSKDTTSLDIESTDLLHTINQPIKGLKIGIVKEFNLGDLDSEVQNRFEDSKKLYETLGAEFVEISLPNISASVPTYYSIAPAECSSNLSRFDGVRFGHRAENKIGRAHV